MVHTLEELLAKNFADPIINREVISFQNHREQLKYADMAARNAPIGSGSMESACGQFQDRLKRLQPAFDVMLLNRVGRDYVTGFVKAA